MNQQRGDKMSLKKVNLQNIGNGVVGELFDREMQAVLKNIEDINTPAVEARKISIEIAIKPTEDRDMGMVTVKCQSKLAKVKPAVSAIFVGKEGGKLHAYSSDPKQEEMQFGKNTNIVGMKVEG